VVRPEVTTPVSWAGGCTAEAGAAALRARARPIVAARQLLAKSRGVVSGLMIVS